MAVLEKLAPRDDDAIALPQAQFADLIPYSKSMISMVETAKRSPLDAREGGRITSKFTEYCDKVLETGGVGDLPQVGRTLLTPSDTPVAGDTADHRGVSCSPGDT